MKRITGLKHVLELNEYEQTGKQAAVWGCDIRWLGDVEEIVQHVKRHRYILTLHWHWFFGEDSAWTGKRKTPVDAGKTNAPLVAGGFGAGVFLGAVETKYAEDCRLADLEIKNVAGQGMRARNLKSCVIERCPSHRSRRNEKR